MEQKYSYYKKHQIREIDVRQPTGNAFDGLRNYFLRTYPIIYTDDPTDYNQVKKYKDTDEFVWIVDRSIKAPRIFPWWFVPKSSDEATVFQFPYIFKNSRRVKDWNKVQLVSTTAEEWVMARQKYICGVYDPYCGKEQFDMFFIGDITSKAYQVLSKKYPNIVAVKSHSEAVEKTTTDLFWLVPDDIIINPKFDFSFCPDEWSYKYIHVFRNGDYYDGVALFPKNANVSSRELSHRFYTEKKEIKIQASKPSPFDIVFISYGEPDADENYANLLTRFPNAKRVHGVENVHQAHIAAAKLATTGMFWVVDADTGIDESFKFEIAQMAHYDRYSRSTVYIWRWCSKTKDLNYVNVKLLPRDLTLELNLTKTNIVESISGSFKPMYDLYCGKEKFDMFFIGDTNSPTWKQLLKKYPSVVAVSTFKEAAKKSTTDLFWLVPDDIIINSKFNFSFCPDEWSHHYAHVFRNGDYYDGIGLFPRNIKVTNRELLHRFYTEKKEIKIQASKPRPFDIVFISYNEPNADENYANLLKDFPYAKRIDGVEGIHQAHIEAAKLATTGMFWVVDADAVIDPDFKFEIEQMAHYDRFSRSTVYVWKSRNCINDLEYGYGGVKLLPRELTLNMDVTNHDMTTSISASFKSMPEISNVTAFNTDEFSTWRSAFRECVKLSSKVIDRQKDDETEARLEAWCTVGADRPFGKYAIMGALAGKKYGKTNKKKPAALAKINDFEWLKDRFEKDSAKG